MFYLGASGAAVWSQVWVDPSSQVPMVRSSGAIGGVLGTYLLLFPHSKADPLHTIGLIMHVRLPAVVHTRE
jgi:membrane associated rhomboid family serine protease